MGTAIELTSPDGFRLSAYRAEPAGTPRGGLVVVQEIFGVNAHIRSVCDGYAADGYLAVAPALFDRYQRGVDWGYSPEDIARGREVRAQADAAAALMDIVAARDAAAKAGPVGIVGYCWAASSPGSPPRASTASRARSPTTAAACPTRQASSRAARCSRTSASRTR